MLNIDREDKRKNEEGRKEEKRRKEEEGRRKGKREIVWRKGTGKEEG